MTDFWKVWVDSILVNAEDKVKCSDNAGIYGLDGKPWSQSANFNLTQKEVKDAIAVLDQAPGGTVIIGNTKYIVLKTDGDHLMAKYLKKGITIAKAKTCVIIGQYEDSSTVHPGDNVNRVCTVRDQLIANEY